MMLTSPRFSARTGASVCFRSPTTTQVNDSGLIAAAANPAYAQAQGQGSGQGQGQGGDTPGQRPRKEPACQHGCNDRQRRNDDIQIFREQLHRTGQRRGKPVPVCGAATGSTSVTLSTLKYIVRFFEYL